MARCAGKGQGPYIKASGVPLAGPAVTRSKERKGGSKRSVINLNKVDR